MNPNSLLKSKSRSIITLGFSAIILLLVVLAITWLQNVSNNDDHLHSIVEELDERQLIFNMRDATFYRAISLFRMLEIKDVFDRDEEFIKFSALGGDFIASRDELLMRGLSDGENDAWLMVKPVIRRGAIVSNKVINLIRDDKLDQAHDLLFKELIPLQKEVLLGMTEMLLQARDRVKDEVNEASASNRDVYVITLPLVLMSLLVCVFIAIYVIRRSNSAEKDNLRQTRRTRTLYNVSAAPGLSLGDVVDEMLKSGCDLFGVEIGKVCIIDRKNKTNTFLHTYAPQNPGVVAGMRVPLEKTFCSETIKSTEPIVINHAGESRFKDLACYEASKLEAYIAMPILVGGEEYGTVNFSSFHPRKNDFDESDVDLIKQIASWIKVTIEREQAEENLKVAKEVAENASHAKSSFVANMSHEIRTPLTAIIGFSNLLLNVNQDDEQRTNLVNTIIKNSTHLNEVVNDVLDLSKIEAGQLEVEAVEVAPTHLMGEVESLMGARARDAGLKFNIGYHFPVPKVIMSDSVRIKQVLINLCGNAIKFTREGAVSVNVSYDDDKREILVSVIDTGVGMSEEEMLKIFQPFIQADASTTRKYGGTGLGLCISSKIAKKLGGDIVCKSEKNIGSQFDFSFSVGDIENIEMTYDAHESVLDEPGWRSQSRPQPLQGLILLAEDNPDNQQLIALYVEKTGATMKIASDGEMAVQMALAEDFDLILMDVQMPKMDGLSATKLLRESGYNRPIVTLTANSMKEDRDSSFLSGADNYMVKPIDLGRFYKTLNKYLTPLDDYSEGVDNPESDMDVGFDAEFAELVRKFLAGVPEILSGISAASVSQDWDTVKRLSHNLKGMGGGFGFQEITDAAALLNDNVNDEDFDSLHGSVVNLREVCNRIISENISEVDDAVVSVASGVS